MYLDDFVSKANNTIFEYEEPLSYLHKRGLEREDIKKFKIGFLKIARFKRENSSDYKYLYERSNGFKFLQNKIIFPLKNIVDRTNGLITRDIKEKRYTQYFLSEAKSIGAFFGLPQALPHIKKAGYVFVHEGCFDSISFSKIYPNSVSSLTSFLNEAQYETLRFFANTIILVYDNDKAGHVGFKKLKDRYGSQNISNIILGSGDSNSYYTAMGQRNFKSFLDARIPFIFRKTGY